MSLLLLFPRARRRFYPGKQLKKPKAEELIAGGQVIDDPAGTTPIAQAADLKDASARELLSPQKPVLKGKIL